METTNTPTTPPAAAPAQPTASATPQAAPQPPTPPAENYQPTPPPDDVITAKRRTEAVDLLREHEGAEVVARQPVRIDPTQKLKRDARGRFIKGTGSPAGFNVNPQNASPGGWSTKRTITYWYKFFMGMTTAEARKWRASVPEEQRTMVQEIAYQRIVDAKKSGNGALYATQEIADRTEGKAKQIVAATVAQSPLDGMNLTAEQLAAIAFTDISSEMEE